MKIGIDASILARKKITGINRYLQNLLKNIPEIDKKNEYYLFSFGESELSEYKIKGFNVIYVGKNKIISSKYYSAIWLNFALPSALKKYKIDLFFQPNHFLPFFFDNKKIKSVITVHDLIPKIDPKYRDLIYKTYLNIFLPLSIKKSQKIITVSESSKKDILKFYNVPAEKIYVIHEAADDKFKQRILSTEQKKKLISQYNLPEKFILHVGAIENRKNILGILKIGDLIKNIDKNIKIVLVGKPGYGASEIFKEIEKCKNVYYIGHIDDEDLPYIYNLAKLFLFPSFYEGFGLPPLEAMQSGLPTLASNTSSILEVVGEGGIIHDPRDYEGFAKDIINLLKNKNFYQEMQKKAISRAKDFSWKISTKKLIEVFNIYGK